MQNNRNNNNKVENIAEFINQELQNKYKYILSPVINYIYRNNGIDRKIRNYFSHYSHKKPNLLTNNKSTILDILDEIVKNSPSSFAVQTFAKISSEYNKYLKSNIYNFIPSLYKTGQHKIIYNKEKDFLEINDYRFIFRIPSNLWKYFFKYNEEKHFYELNEEIREKLRKKAFKIKEKNTEDCNCYKNKKTMRIGQNWINDLNLELQIPAEKEKYLKQYIDNNYSLNALAKKVNDKKIIQSNLKEGFFNVEKIKKELCINFINKQNQVFFRLNIIDKKTYEANRAITHYLVNLHSTKMLTKLLPIQKELKQKDGIYYLELTKIKNKENDTSRKLKNALDIVLGKNFSYSVNVIKCLFNFEEEFFIKDYNDEEHEYVMFELKSLNKKHLEKELQKCGIKELNAFFEELKEIRNHAFHGDFAPNIAEEAYPSLQKLINYCSERSKQKGIPNPYQLSSPLYNLGIAVEKYSKREQFNP